MKAAIDTLKRDINIHKEVEKELAKRSHFCQEVIKRLKMDIKVLQAQAIKNNNFNDQNSQMMYNTTNNIKQPGPIRNEIRGHEDLVSFLENKLEQHEKNLQQKHGEYETLQTEHAELLDKFNQTRQKYKRAGYLLTEFLNDLLTDAPSILNPDKEMYLNLNKI